MARCGVASRRASERIIAAGRVTVNGHTVTRLGTTVDARHDEVRVDGRLLQLPTTFVYVLLNKPAGYVTTVRDPRGRPTVMHLVSDIRERIYPVGRLDADTTGLLLLTNDGALANRLTHPRHRVPKTYAVSVRGRVSPRAVDTLRRGVPLHDGPTAPARVRVEARTGPNSELRLTIYEGRNRQVRRMCRAVGHPVVSLERIAFGPITLGDVPRGSYRLLGEDEVARLRRSAADA